MRSLLILATIALTFCAAASEHPMVSPEIDIEKPFCYYSRPTDQLGVMDAPKGFMVTSEGYLYNRAAEMMFMYGPELEPTHNRNRYLENNIYPIVNYKLEKLGIRYSFKMFAFNLERGVPRSPLYAFVRVTMENVSNTRGTAFLATGLRHRGLTPRIEAHRSYAFQRESSYEFRGDAIMRNDEILAVVQNDPRRKISATIDNPYEGTFRGSQYAVTETTPVCIADYAIDLNPGENRSLTFLMPNNPTNWNAAATMFDLIKDSSTFDRKLREVKEDWDKFLMRMVELKIPEEKVEATFWTSLINMAIARDDCGDGYYSQGVNEMQYTGFFPRDSMYFSWSWLFAGLPEEGKKVADYYEKTQHDDGRFYNDQENIGPYAVLMWYYKTKDREYLDRMWPRLVKNFNYVTNIIANDPLKLMPAMGPYDNEGITGHYTAHNFYNAKAFEMMASCAKELGQEEESKKYRAYADNFISNMMYHVNAAIATNGFIPPGIDTGKSGAHWGNMEASYPTFVMGSHDERVKKTIDYIRNVDWSDEGLIMFNALGCNCLHHYNTMKASMADLYMGRDENVIKDLYGVLLHTSSTHAFFEFCLDPWNNRDFGGNFTPHGWGHVKYVSLIRNMLIREDECSNLFLLSAVAPLWTMPGKEIVARRFNTQFGNVDLVAKGTREGLKVDLNLDQQGGVWGKPNKVFIKVPYYALRATVTVDGKETPIGKDNQVEIPLNTKEVMMYFKRSEEPIETYNSKVRWYIGEYARRFDEWRKENPFTALWECFPEKKLQNFDERQLRDQQLKSQEGLMTFLPILASSTDEKCDHRALDDGIANDNTPKFWRPAKDDSEPWFECSLEEPTSAYCIKLFGNDIAEAKAKIYVTKADGEEMMVGDSANPELPIHGKLFTCTFKQTQIKKVRVAFEGKVGKIYECTLLGERDCWHQGIPRNHGKVGDLAYNRPVFTSPSENPTESQLVDGETDCSVSMWSGAPPHPQWAVIDLGEETEFSRIHTYFFHDGHRCYSYRYSVSPDMHEWKEIGGKENCLAVKDGDELTFEPVKGRYVMIVIDKNTDNPAGHVAEVEIYAKKEE